MLSPGRRSLALTLPRPGRGGFLAARFLAARVQAARIPAALLLSVLILAGALPLAGQGVAPPPFTPELAVQTFDSAWSRIANTHYDPAMGGVDWDGVREELEPRARASTSHDELRQVLREMVATLGLSHFAIFPPEAARTLEGGAPGEGDAPSGTASPGMELALVDEVLAVTRVRPGGPADQAGVRPGWTLVSIEDQAMDALAQTLAEGREERERALNLPSAASALLQGPQGTEVGLHFTDPEGQGHALSLGRVPPPGEVVRFGFLPPFTVRVEVEELPEGEGPPAALIRFNGWFPPIVGPLAEAVDRHRSAPGLILDLRGNPGGLGAMAMGVAGHFMDEPLSLGEMRTRETTLRFVVAPQRVSPAGVRVQPYEGPLAILVDGRTGSTSEIFAAGLQALGRARVFGEATAGQALPAVVIPLPNGDRLMHVVADYTAPGEVRLEGRGVLPDESVPLTREALGEGRDPVVEAARAWIRAQGHPSP